MEYEDIWKRPNRFLMAFLLAIGGAVIGYLTNWLAYEVFRSGDGLEAPLVITHGPLMQLHNMLLPSSVWQRWGPSMLWALYGIIVGLTVGTRKTRWVFRILMIIHWIFIIVFAIQTKFFVGDVENLRVIRVGILWAGVWFLSFAALHAGAFYAAYTDDR